MHRAGGSHHPSDHDAVLITDDVRLFVEIFNGHRKLLLPPRLNHALFHLRLFLLWDTGRPEPNSPFFANCAML